MTPLIALVGFLGAGKTTYLRALLPELSARGLEPHVIINDYQNALVDAELVRDRAAGLTAISGSCVCCGSREELIDALARFEHGHRRVLLLETSGTTDAAELLELLALEPALDHFTPPVQLSVIDGTRWQKRFWHNRLELDQVRTATFRHTSRATEISAERRARLAQSFADHDLLAPERAPAALADEIVAMVDAVAHLPGRRRTADPADCACGHTHDHEPAPHHHHDATAYHFASLQIDLPAIVARSALTRFLDALPAGVLRVKGLARLAESPEEFHIFQRVEDAPPQWLPIGPTSRLPQPVAVLIGPQLDPAAITRLAATTLSPANG